MKQRFRKIYENSTHNLRLKIAIIYIILVLIPVGLSSLVNFRLAGREMESLLIKNTMQIAKNQLDSLDELYNRANEVAVQLMLNPEVKTRLKEYDGKMTREGIERYNYIKNDMNNIMVQRSEYSNIAIIPSAITEFEDRERQPFISVNYMGDPEEVIKTDWYRKSRYTFDVPCLLVQEPLQKDRKAKGEEPDLVLIHAFKNLNNDKKLGVICLTISNYQIRKIFSSFEDSMQYEQLVMDQDGNVIIDNTSDREVREYLQERNVIYQGMDKRELSAFQETLSGKKYLIVGGLSFASGFKIQYAIPKEIIFHVVSEIKKVNVMLSFFCLIFAIAVICVIFWQVLLPLKGLKIKMQQVGSGNLSVRAVAKGDGEIQCLTQNFNAMVESIEDKNREILEGERKKREYEIIALQAQINPHFLYNTLDSIKWTAMVQGNKTIGKMAQYLILLLRGTISDSREFIPLKEQVQNVTYYMKLQELRYYNSFDYDISLPPELEAFQTPKIILQPLVENALFHGIYNCGRRGKIHIEFSVVKGILTICVWDNGKGMDEEKTRKAFHDRKKESFSGIGIHNVDERIKLYYGGDYGLTFESVKDEYTKAMIRIPYEEGEAPGRSRDV